MKPNGKVVIMLGVVLYCVAALAADARATNDVVDAFDCPYFNARQEVNVDGLDPDTLILRDMKSYLQAYRVIRHRPQLARLFSQQHPKFERGISLDAQLEKLRLTPRQISREPTHIYTIHILTCRKLRTLHQFIARKWLSNQMPKRQIYKSRGKSVSMVIIGGDVDVKHDPLYTERIIFKGRKLTRLCYGTYENITDANRDRRVLQHCLGQRLLLRRELLTTPLLNRTWFDSVAGLELAQWEKEAA